ncbi:flagellar assembly protein FliH [Sporosarcina ureilytica]|uniref:Flagellar assembly protein FliH n=1 Tax=Sporosarcina ureilytica TaxID=298596 RepID=A0A1D8JHS2_9BACL|nr:flagellar assembly protein FliH [Sporosarcina ureilytica]
MSNVFKSFQASAKVPTRQISIRNFNRVVEEIVDESNAMDLVLLERERQLENAQKSMEEERKSIQNMRQTAAQDIEAMQSAWKEERAQLEQRAYDEGFQIGFTEGRDKALADMKAAIEQANKITQKSKESAEEYQASQERVILELALRAAERILNEALEEDENKFLSVVKKALIEVREMKEVKLYVSVDDYGLVSANRSELAAIFPPDTPFLIFANEDFEATECYVETNHGRIVVSIDEQLNELRENLIEILESED